MPSHHTTDSLNQAEVYTPQSPNTNYPHIYIAADHGGWQRKNTIRAWCVEQGYTVIDVVPELDPEDDYPVVAQKIASALDKNTKTTSQNMCFGIAICSTGQGICMALNRHRSIRAGLTTDAEIASLLRQHNDANVLCLPGRFATDEQIFLAIRAFLTTSPDPAQRHQRRIQQLTHTGMVV